MNRVIDASFIGVLIAVALSSCGSQGSKARHLPGVATQPLPKFDPANFVRSVDNPYFPLRPGTTLRYRGVKDGESAVDVFSVTPETKTILGVRTTVVRDRLYLKGKLEETTTDWYAQDRDGNVWYLGEATYTVSPSGRALSSQGTWQAGVNGARAGIFVPGNPRVGQGYQQEYYKGQAQDNFQVLSLSASIRVPYGTSKRALLTQEWTPLEPGVIDHKYYVRGVGTVSEGAVKGGTEHLVLTSVTR